MSGKKIVLCGSKGAGKSEILKALKKQGLEVKPNKLGNGKKGMGNHPVDRLADYRTEIELALHRAFTPISEGVHEDSLIDNISYAATRISFIINDEIGDEDDLTRWQLAMHTAARFLRDGWNYDAVIFVPGHDSEEFYVRLEEAIYASIFEFLPENVAKFTLESEGALQRAEEIAKILEELDGQGKTDSEFDGEDS